VKPLVTQSPTLCYGQKLDLIKPQKGGGSSIHRELMGITLWLFNIAMENGPFIDGLPIKNGDFPWLC